MWLVTYGPMAVAVAFFGPWSTRLQQLFIERRILHAIFKIVSALLIEGDLPRPGWSLSVSCHDPADCREPEWGLVKKSTLRLEQ